MLLWTPPTKSEIKSRLKYAESSGGGWLCDDYAPSIRLEVVYPLAGMDGEGEIVIGLM